MSNDDTTKQLPTEDKLDSLITLVHHLTDSVKNVESRLGSVETRLESVESRLESLEQKVDARLQETRPIWEGVLARIENIEISVDKVQAVVFESRADLRELRREFKEHLPAMK